MSDALHNVMVTVNVPTGPATPGADGTAQRVREPQSWGPCNFQPATSSESRNGVHTIAGEWFISGPLAHWIVPGSTVTVGPGTFRVKGYPKHFASGVLDHTEMTLIDQEG